MTISLACDTCGRSYQLKDEAAGKRIRCKDCETILVVPELDAGVDDYDDDPWGSGGSAQDDFWNNSDDDEWGDTSGGSGAYSAPPAYPVQSGGRAVGTTSPRAKKPKKKKRSTGGSGGNVGALIGKIAGGVFVALVVIGLIFRVGGALGKMGLGGSLSWEEFNVPGTPFAMQMPGKPKQGSQFQAGISITQFMYESRRPERAFGLMHADLPLPAGAVGTLDAADVNEVFRESKQGMILAAPGARVHSESNISITDTGGNSHPGVELTVSVPHQGKQLKFTYRLFLIGTRMLITLAGSEDDRFSSSKADFDKFLNSLKITQAVTPLIGNGAQPRISPAEGNGHPFNPAPDNRSLPGAADPGLNEPFSNPATESLRRMEEENERRMQESRERMERMRRESEERMREIRNRSRNPPRPPGFP